jgi:hypothetical protein
MCLKLVSVNAGAQLFHVNFQLERASTGVPFAVKSAKYSMGENGQEFAIADCDISLQDQSFLESPLLGIWPWGSKYYNGVFYYHDFLAASPPIPSRLMTEDPPKLPWDYRPFMEPNTKLKSSL